MIPKSNYVSEYFSEILISVKQAKAENTYSDQYFALIDPVSKALEKLKMSAWIFVIKKFKK